MRVSFTLDNIGPLSINQVYYGNRAHGWTAEAKEWSYKLMYQIAKHDSQIKLIRDLFDPKTHGLNLTLTFYYKGLQKSAGGISSRTVDLSNCEKTLIDVLFTKKFYGTNVPYTCQNFNIDDKYIIDLYSRKREGKQRIEVEVAVVPLSA